jgi:Rod binding domain-containing protein
MDIKHVATDELVAMAGARRPGMTRIEALEIKKVKKAASEFESMLISNWWNTMKQSGLDGGEDESDPGKDTLDQMGIQALSAAIANGKGGLGLGNMLAHSLMERMDEAKLHAAAHAVHGWGEIRVDIPGDAGALADACGGSR